LDIYLFFSNFAAHLRFFEDETGIYFPKANTLNYKKTNQKSNLC
jgi:hypothetical protein